MGGRLLARRCLGASRGFGGLRPLCRTLNDVSASKDLAKSKPGGGVVKAGKGGAADVKVRAQNQKRGGPRLNGARARRRYGARILSCPP